MERFFPLIHEMLFITEKQIAEDAPHIVLEIGVIERHAPTLGGRRKRAQHQQSGILGQEWFKGMSFYHCG